MMEKRNILLIAACILFASYKLSSQLTKTYGKDGLKIYLSEDSTRYIKGSGLAQIWVRYNTSNPGSVIHGTPKSETFDVGLRRVRYQVFSQINSKVFFYSQFGINNQNSLSPRKMQLFFHDATAEYRVLNDWLVLGAGLHGWNGTARFSSSSVSSIMALDLPIIEETTNDINDQFVRRLGIYAKGKLGGFDYRFSIANPFPVQTTATTPGVSQAEIMPANIVNTAYYSVRAPELNYQSYLMWQFLDREPNQTPYMVGSYLGKKRVLNIGAGFMHQKNAMWYRNMSGDTISKPLQQIGIDIFYDSYIDGEKQNAITAYLAFLNYDFGPNYIRNAGPMNPTTGVSGPASKTSFNGAGNAFPLIGTGQVVYGQAAYLFRKDLLGKQGTLQPYLIGSYAHYQKLKDPVMVYHVGLNWIMDGNNSKLSLDFQSRPIFANPDANGEIREIKSARRGQIVLQYQVAF